MMKKNCLYLLISLLLLNFSVVNAQIRDTSIYEFTDSLELVYPESELDTTLAGKSEIDEDLNDIFSGTLDSSSNAWHHKTKLSAFPEVRFNGQFPKDLPDSVYIQRLMDTEQVIDLSYNKVVRNFIQMYTEKKRGQVEMMLGLSDYYFPIFEETLDKYGLPLELKYLPIIESALNPVALSRVGANGLWQFMYGTAKNMNLEITSFVDERRDPVKSSEAAARYLKMLYDMYNDWHLAIAAYNCGPGNVNRAIKRSGGKTNYWDIYYRLPRETRGYVPLFIAATYVMNYYREHNLYPQIADFKQNVDTVMVNDFLHFDQLAAKLSLDKEEIQYLNPMYRRSVVPAKTDKPYPLVLPQEKIMQFLELDTAVFAYEREKYFPNNTLVKPTESSSSGFVPSDIKGKAKIVYTVKSGDNVGYISNWFKTWVNDLKYWNNINGNMIRAGQKLAIYVPEKDKEQYANINSMSFAEKQAMIGKSVKSEKEPATSPQAVDGEYEYYTVKNGDNVWLIAQKFDGISSEEILRLNKISNEKGLYIGQKLKIRKKS